MPQHDSHHTHSDKDPINTVRVAILAVVVLIIATGVFSVIAAG